MDKDVTELLDAIVWAHRIVEVEEKAFVFRPLTLEERNMSNFIYTQEMEKLRTRNMLTREELKRRAMKEGLWKKVYDRDAGLLREALAALLRDRKLEIEATKHRKNESSTLIRLDRKIMAASTTLREIERLHMTHIELPSAEYHAEGERGLYCLHCAAMTFPDMEKMWPTRGDLDEFTDTGLVASLMNQYYAATIAEESEIRLVARSGIWRSKWMGSKKNRGVKTLFNREMYDLTVDQFRLVYWSQIYDSAFESMESPSDEVLEDDVLFDRWLDDQNTKRKQERKKTEFDKKVSHLTKDGQEVALSVNGFYSDDCNCGLREAKKDGGKEKLAAVHPPSCPYGIFMYYNTETIDKKVEEVQSANPQNIRQLLGKEQGRLAKASGDLVQEQDLRGNDRTRAALGMGTNYTGKGEQRGKQGRAGRP